MHLLHLQEFFEVVTAMLTATHTRATEKIFNALAPGSGTAPQYVFLIYLHSDIFYIYLYY